MSKINETDALASEATAVTFRIVAEMRSILSVQFRNFLPILDFLRIAVDSRMKTKIVLGTPFDVLSCLIT